MELPRELPPVCDPLGEALHLLQLEGSVYARSELNAPWGVDLPELEGHMMFHVVTSGHCWLEIEGEAPLRLERGGLALVPHGLGHRLVSAPGTPCEDFFDLPVERLSERYEFLRHGGGGEECRLICVCVRFDHAAADRLIDLLPPVLWQDAWDDGDDRRLMDTLSFIACEAEALHPGGETIITRLADVLVIQTLRRWIESTSGARTGWLAALRDDRLGLAIAAMHRTPQIDWTLNSLARTAKMSRSAFAAHFTEVVGEPAMRYLGRWRLRLAHSALRATQDPLGDVSRASGYASEAAFSRAFKREFGVPPSEVRRRGTALPAGPA